MTGLISGFETRASGVSGFGIQDSFCSRPSSFSSFEVGLWKIEFRVGVWNLCEAVLLGLDLEL